MTLAELELLVLEMVERLGEVERRMGIGPRPRARAVGLGLDAVLMLAQAPAPQPDPPPDPPMGLAPMFSVAFAAAFPGVRTPSLAVP